MSYRLRRQERVMLRKGANLSFTTSGLRSMHTGVIVDFTAGMFDKTDEMYDVLFDGEDESRYILFSDLQREN